MVRLAKHFRAKHLAELTTPYLDSSVKGRHVRVSPFKWGSRFLFRKNASCKVD